MPLFKKKTTGGDHSRSTSGEPGTGEETNSSSTSTPYLVDYTGTTAQSSGSTPVLAKDHLSPTSTSTSSPSSDTPATLLLGTDPKHGDAALGSSNANPGHPDLLTNRAGQPILSLPQAASQSHLTEVLTSGQKGLGKNGEEAVRSLDSHNAKIGEGAQGVVVGQAKGLAPEIFLTTDLEENSSSSWIKRFGEKLSGSSGKEVEEEFVEHADSDRGVKKEEDQIDERPQGITGINAMSTVAPSGVTGVDLSNVGISGESGTEPHQQQQTQGSISDKNGKVLPTSLHVPSASHRTSTSNKGTESVTSHGSIKDQIGEEYDLAPRTSNEKFHSLFSQVPEDDELIEDYRCALQREILAQGRLYVSEHHLAFRANVVGWKTTAVIPWSEIVTIEKRMSAFVIPNAIEISTIHAKHLFASFLSRDQSYDLIVSIWRHHHPEEIRVRDRSATVSTTETDSNDDSKSEVSYEDEDGRKKKYRFKPRVPSVLKSLVSSKEPNASGEGQTESEKIKEEAQDRDGGGGGNGHPETTYPGEEFKNVVMEINLTTSPEKAYELMFKDLEFLRPFWKDNQGLKDIKEGEWTKNGAGVEEREMSYIKPLNASMGPKETLCNIKDESENADPEGYYTDVTTTQTPDVPSGSNFSTKTRTVLRWNKNGGVNIKVTTEVVWTKVNRMLKGIIEKSCLDGQKTFHKELETAIKAYIKSHAADFAIAGASESEEVVVVEEPESLLDTALSYATDPIVLASIGGLLGLLLLVLVVYKYFPSSRGTSARDSLNVLPIGTRIGNPAEVASAVERVLQQFSQTHAKEGRSGRAEEVGIALSEILTGLDRLEREVGGLRDRVAGLLELV